MLLRVRGGDGPGGEVQTETIDVVADHDDGRHRCYRGAAGSRGVPDQHQDWNEKLAQRGGQEQAGAWAEHEQAQQALLIRSAAVPIGKELAPDEVEPQQGQCQEELGRGMKRLEMSLWSDEGGG